MIWECIGGPHYEPENWLFEPIGLKGADAHCYDFSGHCSDNDSNPYGIKLTENTNHQQMSWKREILRDCQTVITEEAG